jgi:hypothetical protein
MLSLPKKKMDEGKVKRCKKNGLAHQNGFGPAFSQRGSPIGTAQQSLHFMSLKDLVKKRESIA